MQRIHALPELTAATRNHAVMGVAAQGSSGVGVVLPRKAGEHAAKADFALSGTQKT